MKRQSLAIGSRVLVALVATGVAGALVWRHLTDSSPGTTTSDWIRALDSGDRGERAHALRNLAPSNPAEMDTAITAATRALSDPEAPVRVEAAVALARFGAANSPGSESPDVDRARSIARSLLDAFQRDQDAGVRASAAFALASIYRAVARMGKPAADSAEPDPLKPETLVAAFDTQLQRDPANRISLIAPLEQLGPLSMPAPPGLQAVVDDPSIVVRGQALLALSHFRGGADGAVLVLLEDLANNTGPFAPDYAAMAAAMHPTPVVVPALIQSLESDDGLVREAAATLLARVEPAPKSAARSLIAAVKKAVAAGEGPDSGRDRMQAVPTTGGGALAPRGGRRREQPAPGSISHDLAIALAKAAAPEESVPLLVAVLKRRGSESRIAAAIGLDELGPAAHAAIPALIVTLKEAMAAEGNTASGYGGWAARALGHIAPKAAGARAASQDAIAVLAEALDARNDSIRGAAAQALGDFGPEAARAIPRLRALREDKDTAVQNSARSALERIEPPFGPTSAAPAAGKGR
jgi:HEAT repeat protein